MLPVITLIPFGKPFERGENRQPVRGVHAKYLAINKGHPSRLPFSYWNVDALTVKGNVSIEAKFGAVMVAIMKSVQASLGGVYVAQ